MDKDLKLAQRICEELRRGNTHAVMELITLYGHTLEVFTIFKTQKTYGRWMVHYQESKNTEYNPIKDLIQDFWVTKMMEKKAVCGYKGRNGASLKTYLFSIMMNLIMEQGRKIKKRHDVEVEEIPDVIKKADLTVPNEEDIIKHVDDKGQLDDAFQEELTCRFKNIALECLSQKRPDDATLVLLRMNGVSFREIAQRFLLNECLFTDDNAIKKKAAALRKQCTRDNSGSFARFADIFKFVVEEHGYEHEELDEKVILKKKKI